MSRTKLAGSLLVIAALSTLALLLGRRGATPAIRDENGRILPGSVASLEKVRLGGMEQWILIRGEDHANPVLLWLHGGPGAPQMPLAHHLDGALEEAFVVVHWDQRGAGKSNPPDFDEETMTLQRFVDDAHELTRTLKERFHKEGIYLLGHSWGTQIGIKLAQAYPEDYHAYVAVGQVVNAQLSQEIGRAWLLEQIAARGNEKDLQALQALGTPPYTDHEQYVSYARLIDAYGGDFDVSMTELLWITLQAPEYAIGDIRAALRGMNRGSGPMWHRVEYQSYDAMVDVPRLRVPVFFLNGRHDYITPLQATREYFERLEAPRGKELIVFEESAHTPFLGETETFNQALINVKKSVTE